MIDKSFNFIDNFVGDCVGKRVSEVEVRYSDGKFNYTAFYTTNNHKNAQFSKEEKISDKERELIRPFPEVCRRVGYLKKVINKCPNVAAFDYKKSVVENSVCILVAPLKGTENLPLEMIVE